MVKLLKSAFCIALLLFIFSCKNQNQTSIPKDIQIAFMSDIHLSDIYGTFEDCDYRGVVNPGDGKNVIIRSMNSQLHSTRIFNENYFAFRAALDDVVKREIKYVVLPGDFSDDGQPYNVRGLKTILDSYSSTYGIQFFAINGNHDPVAPFSIDAGKTDFLGKEGKPQAIMSREGLYIPNDSKENPVVITKDICKMGYEQITKMLENEGFYPKKSYKYWETPFSTYSYKDYSFEKAVDQASFIQRSHSEDALSPKLPDISYLVEPVEGLWLLALDGNVYLPSENDGNNYSKAKLNGGGEYSNIIAHKQYLINWVKKVVKESKRLNKTLIAFSHYPMVDFYEDATDDMKSLFGGNKMQLFRVPGEDVSELFAKAGIKLHFAGHMHLNDTGIRKYDDGSFLVNIQVPSLAGYPAAYKILTIKSPELMDIETVRIDSVNGFNRLFPLYEKEYAYLQSIGSKDYWNKDILNVKSYGDFINWHLKELVRLRFLKEDWPEDLKSFLSNISGNELLTYVGGNTEDSAKYSNWTGSDMIFDFYRLLYADDIAMEDIEVKRLKEYRAIINAELDNSQTGEVGADSLKSELHTFMLIFSKILRYEPSNHFEINMKDGDVTDKD